MKKRQNEELEQLYGYIVHDPKPNPRQDASLKGIEIALKDAFGMFNKTKAIWTPVGGIELTTRFGAVTRNHSDIDIEIEEKQLPMFKREMENQGYKLCEKLISMKINFPNYKKRIMAYKHCNKDEHLLKKQIRLIHTELNNANIHYLLKVIDIKICKFTPEGTIINNRGNLITINKPYFGQVTEFKGEPVQLRSREYYTTIKSLETKVNKYKRDTDAYDKILSGAKKVKYEKGPPVDDKVTYTYREITEK